MDAYGDQPLRYRQLGQGYIVYSLGLDGVDNGGKEKPAKPGETEQYDLTFTVERPTTTTNAGGLK